MIEETKVKKIFIKLLLASPRWIQVQVGNFYLRYGLPISFGPKSYLMFYKFLKESQWWPRWKLEAYQVKRLKQLLRYAYNNVPYYSEVFRKEGIIPDDIRSIGDLRKLPILTKEEVIRNFDKLVSRKVKKKYLKIVKTSGSTGKPMQFYLDRRLEFIEFVFMRRLFDEINIKVYDKHIYLWSRPFIERNIKDIYLYEPHLKRMSLSSTPHSFKLWGKYLELIREFKPAFIQGNPSMLYNLACYAQENNINNIKFNYFINFFENLFLYQRELIEKQFGCKIYNNYLSRECVVSTFECSEHKGMHIDMEKGILEILGDNEKVLPEGLLGRMVATGLQNFTVPFIRYDTGDIGSISNEHCSCGRGLPLLGSFDGRANETIRHKDKTIYSTTLSVILWKFKNIKECQFVQEREDEIKINVVKRKDYSEKDTSELIKAIQNLIDEKLNISINFVDYITRTKMGKFPFVISKV